MPRHNVKNRFRIIGTIGLRRTYIRGYEKASLTIAISYWHFPRVVLDDKQTDLDRAIGTV
jgi:hypothetical protein